MILALESGGTKLVAAAADEKGKLLEVVRRYRKPEQDARETLAALVEMGQELAKSQGGITAVGYGFGGTVDRTRGQPGPCFHEPGWDQVHASAFLFNAFRVPVFIENDCKLGALAEAQVGFKLTRGTLFYVTIGTGIGGGIVHGGEIFQSGPLGEGEIGHIVVEPEGLPCGCGNRGCLEVYCSGPGLVRLAELTLGYPVDSRHLMEEFRKGDKTATRVVRQAAAYLGRVLAMVVNMVAPRVVVMGGGVMTDNEKFMQLVARETRKLTFPLFRKQPQFKLSRLGENVICQGAALYAIQAMNHRKD